MKAFLGRATVAIREQVFGGYKSRAAIRAECSAGPEVLAARVREVTTRTGSVRRLV